MRTERMHPVQRRAARQQLKIDRLRSSVGRLEHANKRLVLKVEHWRSTARVQLVTIAGLALVILLFTWWH